MLNRRPVLFGGSFNPPHIGHFRLAIELYENLKTEISGVRMLPCALAPHKENKELLPFELRLQMLEAVCSTLDGIECDCREGLRSGPSFTWDTLGEFMEEQPFFAMGSDDYRQLPTWLKGINFPERCELIILPRCSSYGAKEFVEDTQKIWQDARQCVARASNFVSCKLKANSDLFAVHLLQVPWINISATEVRSRWLRGQSIKFLVPDVILHLLHEQAALVRRHWQDGRSEC